MREWKYRHDGVENAGVKCVWKLSATQLIQHITVFILNNYTQVKPKSHRMSSSKHISRIKVTPQRTHNSEET